VTGVSTLDAVARFEIDRCAAQAIKRRQLATAGVLLAVATALSAIVAEVNPRNLAQGLPGAFDYVWRTLPVLRADSAIADLREWYWGLARWLKLLFETVIIAGLATAIATAVAYAGCFRAARNLNPRRWSVVLWRRGFEVARAVPELVYALIFVFAFGLSPLAGTLAVAVHSAGALGKLFSEVNENVDAASLEGVTAAGASWWQVMRFGVTPQVLPNFASYALLRFEINVRSAAVLGFVGAGGIGEELVIAVRQFIYPDISALVLLIVVTIAALDMACERLRGRFMHEVAR
jgi:phosphonate transport system permease protein